MKQRHKSLHRRKRKGKNAKLLLNNRNSSWVTWFVIRRKLWKRCRRACPSLFCWVWKEGSCDTHITFTHSIWWGRCFSISFCAVTMKLTKYVPVRNTYRLAPSETSYFSSLCISRTSAVALSRVSGSYALFNPVGSKQKPEPEHCSPVTAKRSCINLPRLKDLWRSLPVFIKA